MAPQRLLPQQIPHATKLLDGRRGAAQNQNARGCADDIQARGGRAIMQDYMYDYMYLLFGLQLYTVRYM